MTRGSDTIGAQNKLLLMQTRAPEDFDLEMLIRWTRDEKDDVRDWATFTLGVQGDFDSEAVRQALLERIEDRHFETRCEAFVGLAGRQDGRAVEALFKALDGDIVGELLVAAAGYYGLPAFVEPLERLQAEGTFEGPLIDGALRRCRGEVIRSAFWDLVGANDNAGLVDGKEEP